MTINAVIIVLGKSMSVMKTKKLNFNYGFFRTNTKKTRVEQALNDEGQFDFTDDVEIIYKALKVIMITIFNDTFLIIES